METERVLRSQTVSFWPTVFYFSCFCFATAPCDTVISQCREIILLYNVLNSVENCCKIWIFFSFSWRGRRRWRGFTVKLRQTYYARYKIQDFFPSYSAGLNKARSRNWFVRVSKFWILEWRRICMNCEVNLPRKRCYCWNLRDVALLKTGVVEVGLRKSASFVCN